MATPNRPLTPTPRSGAPAGYLSAHSSDRGRSDNGDGDGYGDGGGDSDSDTNAASSSAAAGTAVDTFDTNYGAVSAANLLEAAAAPRPSPSQSRDARTQAWLATVAATAPPNEFAQPKIRRAVSHATRPLSRLGDLMSDVEVTGAPLSRILKSRSHNLLSDLCHEPDTAERARGITATLRRQLYAETSFIAVQGMQSHTSTVVSNISRVNLNVLAAAVEDQKASLADDERTMLFRKASKLEQDLNEDVVTWPLLSAVLVAVVSMFLCGYNTGVMNGPAAVVFADHTPFEWSCAVAAFAIGGPLGAVAGGVLANKRGRRGAMLINSQMFLAGGLVMALCLNVWMLALARFMIGCASGYASVLVPIYLGELAPPALRGTFGTCTQFAMVLGIMAADALAIPLSTPAGWRWLFGLTAALAAAQIALAPTLCETPRYLLSRDPSSFAARGALRRLYGLRTDEDVELEVEHILTASRVHLTKHESAHSSGAFAQLLKDETVRLMLVSAVVLHVTQQMCGINAVFYYSTTFFEGVIEDPAIGSLLVAGVNVGATWMAQLLMDKCPRRMLLLWSIGGMIVMSLVITCALIGMIPKTGALGGVMGFVMFFEVGLGPIPWLIVAEMFDAEYIATTMSFVCQINWACNFIVGIGFPLLNRVAGPWTFVPFAVVLAFAQGFVWIYLPETYQRTTDEIKNEVRLPLLAESRFRAMRRDSSEPDVEDGVFW